MSDPFRDRQHPCPACGAPLREFRTRHVCDACDGMLLTLPDLTQAVHDLTSVQPTFEYREEAPGKRACPVCSAPMSTCKLRIVLEAELADPKPELDRCVEHGVWFDGEELAGVFTKVMGKGYGAGVGRKGPAGGGSAIDRGSGGWRGASGNPEWWGDGGGGKW
jgi:Zn-finger nucleic acid-binding protein